MLTVSNKPHVSNEAKTLLRDAAKMLKRNEDKMKELKMRETIRSFLKNHGLPPKVIHTQQKTSPPSIIIPDGIYYIDPNELSDEQRKKTVYVQSPNGTVRIQLKKKRLNKGEKIYHHRSRGGGGGGTKKKRRKPTS